MNFRTVRVVRIFLAEKGGEAERLLKQLHDQWKVHGVTVYRGVAGFGDSRRMHTTRILDVSHDLPITVEFYDAPERIDEVLATLDHIKPGHLVTWLADMWMGEDV
ncbi:MAG: DUF190 domain-containing protein [Gammaproteobacteria bacterium]